jgi:hypothetical protein
MLLVSDQIVAELVSSRERYVRAAQDECRHRALGAGATKSTQASHRVRLRTLLGDALIAAGERLRRMSLPEPTIDQL